MKSPTFLGLWMVEIAKERPCRDVDNKTEMVFFDIRKKNWLKDRQKWSKKWFKDPFEIDVKQWNTGGYFIT